MRGLLLNYALEQAYHKGDRVPVIKGTRTKPVSEKRLLAEREVYTNMPLDDEAGVAQKLRNLHLGK